MTATISVESQDDRVPADLADLIKTALLRLDRIFRRRNMEARIVMMIHDALWVEAPKEESVEMKHLVRRMMATAAKLSVPLGVDIKK